MFGDSIKAGVKGNRQNGDVLVLAWEILLDLKPQDLLVGRPLLSYIDGDLALSVSGQSFLV
jgi:hypothetical protein